MWFSLGCRLYWPCITEDPLLSVARQEKKINFSKYLERQRKLQPVGYIEHSKQSEMLVSLLQFVDSKRYNIPVTQVPGEYLYIFV